MEVGRGDRVLEKVGEVEALGQVEEEGVLTRELATGEALLQALGVAVRAPEVTMGLTVPVRLAVEQGLGLPVAEEEGCGVVAAGVLLLHTEPLPEAAKEEGAGVTEAV